MVGHACAIVGQMKICVVTSQVILDLTHGSQTMEGVSGDGSSFRYELVRGLAKPTIRTKRDRLEAYRRRESCIT